MPSTTAPADEPMTTPAQENLRLTKVPAGEIRYARVGTGTPIVLLHTLRTQLEYFIPLIAELDATRFELVAVDLPGHGGSSAPEVDYTAGYFTEAVEQLIDQLKLCNATVVGESIGACIGLALAARGNHGVTRVIALNPYDYGRLGGIRRSSALANVLFTAILFPVVGPVVASVAAKDVLRRIMAGGLYDPSALPEDLLDTLHRCGSLPGHARAFRSLMLNWRTWIEARASYPAIKVPVTLAYGEADWSRAAERDANAAMIPGARPVELERSGHFSCLEKPGKVAQLICEAA